MSSYVFNPNQHPDLAHVRDRAPDTPGVERLYFGEGDFTQGADVSEGFTREADARRAVGDLVASDGDRLTGCAVIIDAEAETVTISDGTIYLLGKPRPVAGAVLEDVSMTGTVQIGVYAVTTIITAEDDPQYLGLVEGALSFGESGAVRTSITLTWGVDGDDSDGEFYHFTTLMNGVEIASQAPTSLTGVQKQIALYDYDRSGNYVVRGFDVTPISLVDNTLALSVSAGTADVLGSKVIRAADSRIEIDADPDVASVAAEPQIYVNDGGSCTFRVNRPPIASVSSVIVTKQRTVTLSKGAAGTADALPDSSVSSIVQVKQGDTTYTATTDYIRTGDSVDWSPGGSEPTASSSYDVTYRYLAAVPVDSFTLTEITVSGGVDNEPAFLTYDYKLLRWDRLLLSEDGTLSYLKGRPSPTAPRAPVEPVSALSLAVLKHDWFGVPAVENRTKRKTVDEVNAAIDRLNDALLLIGYNRLSALASGRNTGKTLGIFVDPLNDDRYRDAGETQTLAVVNGSLQLAIDVDVIAVDLGSDLLLNYSNEVSVSQPMVTGCIKINPYQNFDPLPLKLALNPARDFWTEYETEALSAKTSVLGSGNLTRVLSTTRKTTVTTARLSKLREIDVNFTISGMGAGEELDELTFDGIDVNPGDLVANSSGILTGTFTIPDGVSAGKKEVVAVGASGSEAVTVFEGQGQRQTTTVQDFVTILRSQQRRDTGGRGGRSNDPQAETFTQIGGRHVGGISLKFCAIGNRSNPVIVELVTVTDDFDPSTQVIARSWLNMQAVQTGVWTDVLFDLPPFQPDGTYYAFVVKTDDAAHSISHADLGKFDAVSQKWVTAQPYTAGDRFDGSNGRSWLLHPGSDLTFRVLSPKFTPTSRTVLAGTYSVTNASDIQIAADVLIPTADCGVMFRVAVGSEIYGVAAGQTIELSQFYTGDITVHVVLTGTERASPAVLRYMEILVGTMATSGSYVGLRWNMGDPVDLQGSLATKLPAGSTLSVYVDAGDDDWTAVSAVDAVAIDDGFTERFYALADFEAPQGGRIRIDMTGTPAARPSVCDINFSVGA